MVLTVNSSTDDPSGPTVGVETLRDAINAVNNDVNDNGGSPDVINFAVAGITLGGDLPAIDRPVIIDGSTQASVTVNGNGFAMLVDNSTVNLNDVTFTGGTVTLDADSTVTVDAGSTVSVAGDLDAGCSATLNNDGNLSVSGNFVGAYNVGVYNAPFSNGATTYSATFTVEGAFSAGDDSFVFNDGTANFSVAKDFTLGDDGYVYNGQSSSDAAAFTVGGSFCIGVDGYAYNYGDSTISVTGNFSLGDCGYLYNGVSVTDAATLSVGGNFSLGVEGDAYNYGNSTISVTGNFSLGDYSEVSNHGTSTISVTGDFALGNDSLVNNGQYETDAATISVGGNFSIGDSSAGIDDAGDFYNTGNSTFTVNGDFTVYGDGASEVYNGDESTDAATFAVGGSFSLGASSSVSENGTNAFRVANSFTLGTESNFDDFGIMSVGGNFDPGTGYPGNNDEVGGAFNAGPGSTVTTDAATWEVLAGGSLNLAAGADFTVASGGALQVDGGGSMTDQGNLTVEGTLTSAKLSTIVVDYNGQLSTQDGGLPSIQGTLLTWNNPAANICYGTPLSTTQLDATANIPGAFSYTPASGTVLPAGNGQVLNVTFTPYDTADNSSASAQVLVNVVGGQTTPTVSAPPESATYTGSSQGYPTSDVTVTGANGLDSSDGALSFTYNGSSTAPTTAGTYSVVVTFTPTDTTDYTDGMTTTTWTISPATPTVNATPQSTTYTGSSQGYPTSDVTVTGADGLNSSDGTPSFTYNGSSTAPTTAGTYGVVVTFAPPIPPTTPTARPRRPGQSSRPRPR